MSVILDLFDNQRKQIYLLNLLFSFIWFWSFVRMFNFHLSYSPDSTKSRILLNAESELNFTRKKYAHVCIIHSPQWRKGEVREFERLHPNYSTRPFDSRSAIASLPWSTHDHQLTPADILDANAHQLQYGKHTSEWAIATFNYLGFFEKYQ